MTQTTSFNEIKAAITARMESQDTHPDVIQDFLVRVQRVHEGYSGLIPWDQVQDPDPDDYVEHADISKAAPENTEALNQLVVIKLNGGLGTSMGLAKAKSLMPVKEKLSFLEIIRLQLEQLRAKRNAPVPLILMNSFNTQADSLAAPGMRTVNETAPGNLPPDFLQNMVPRIDADSLLPIGDGSAPDHWCPPGHGDIFLALKIRGLLDQLIAAGYRYAFLSNGDNLGATVDAGILEYFAGEELEFMSEVTPKTRADLKGGVLYSTGEKIELLETAQVEPDHLGDFQDIQRFAYFNINNLWVNLVALRKRLDAGDFHLSLIRNPKQVNGQDVLQLETAMGSAIGRFDRTRILIVGRERFAPVKTCADLLVRRSDAYTLRKDSDYALVRNPQRKGGEPVIHLSDHYKKISDFDRLVQVVPSIVELEELHVSGPVVFDVQVELAGRVELNATGSTPVPLGQCLKALGKGPRLENETLELP